MMINKLFKTPSSSTNSQIQQNDSLIMSDELKDELEDFDEAALNAFKERSKIVIVKYTLHEEHEALIGVLKGLGITHHKTLSIELNVEQFKAISFFNDYKDEKIQIFGIEIKLDSGIIDVLQERETPYEIYKCNLYDITIKCDDCTLVLIFKDI